jgi:lysophospholipase L1-like esterase
MKNTVLPLLLISILVACIGMQDQKYCNRQISVVIKYQTGRAVKAVLIGNSIGCGWYATGWEGIKQQPDYRITVESSKDNNIRSYATLLREKLQAANPNSDLINLSANGWNTDDHLGIGQFPGDNSIDMAIALQPDVVFIPLQVNDVHQQRESFQTFQINTRKMVSMLLKANITPVLVTENDIPDQKNGLNMGDYAKEVITIGKDYNIPVIDTYTFFYDQVVLSGGDFLTTGLYYDTLHPNYSGHKLIFEKYDQFFGNIQSHSR